MYLLRCVYKPYKMKILNIQKFIQSFFPNNQSSFLFGQVGIKKVGGKDETRQFLENLGFVAGGTVTVVSEINGNLIVNVKESRVAIGKDMANKIMV